MNWDRLIARLMAHEGLRLRPYRDSVGRLTIGIGRNLDDRGITRDEAIILCGNDVLTAERGLDRLLPWWRQLNEARQQVLCEMTFNLGPGGVLGFAAMLDALQRGAFQRAADEMLDSRWARQVGARATKLAAAMRDGSFPEAER